MRKMRESRYLNGLALILGGAALICLATSLAAAQVGDKKESPQKMSICKSKFGRVGVLDSKTKKCITNFDSAIKSDIFRCSPKGCNPTEDDDCVCTMQ